MKNILKQLCLWTLILTMVLSGPMSAFAQVNHEDLTKDKATIINQKEPKVQPAKLGPNETAADLIKNPDQPAIYTLRTDYKVQRGEKYYVDYQPYIASVGENATDAEKAKVNKTIKLPALAGYDEPQDDFTIDYKTVKEAADGKNATGNDANGLRYSDKQDFKYTAKSNRITIKHVFQDLEDFTKYTNPDGSVGEEGELITTQQGNTGSTMEVSPLNENDLRRKGFVPEAESINMQVPENAENFILEYRYNRAHYDVVYDTAGGTELPARTLYYGQVIPKIADESIPTKVGGTFQGWKPSVDLETIDGSKYRANEIIKDTNGKAILNLAADIKMPPSKVTFTAVWKDKEKAGYAVQFWAEKADHADDASLLDKYDYIGTRVYKDQATGSRPDLDNEPVKDIVFPDLDQTRLNKIWAGARFNSGRNPYLNKFYVYNQDLTHDQNKDPANVNLVKSVDPTGKTVYNIYYDRQVYDLYFTESNYQKKYFPENTFYPEIWGLDKDNNQVKLGGPGDPYHYQARFNQLMLGWPNDAMQTKGFSPKMQSFGWGPNYTSPNWPLHLDTPPYRLNADEFLDMPNYINWGGYKKPIDKGDGTTIPVDTWDFTTLSFGIKQNVGSMPHHMDFWMDGFKPGEKIVRYDLYRSKADTKSPTYQHRYSTVQGFTPKRDYEIMDPFTEDDVDGINAKRAKVTPFPTKTYTDMYGNVRPLGKMPYIYAFFNNADDWGDSLDGNAFKTNGYIKFEYSRNKYPLRFNYDPSKIKGDNEFNSTNQLQTFYEFPLKALSPDLKGNEEYKKDNPANLLDNPDNLKTLGLKDLVFTDTDGKLKVKRPDNLSDQMVFKGWALDPAGTKLIWENAGEKMPNHPVNLYAKWGEPDYKWKVTFDPNGGALRNIKEDNLTTSRKKIQEGDIGQEEINTYAKKEANDGDKQVFTVIQRQKLVEPKYKPTRKGYDFMGWEVIRYKKNQKGDYTDEIDNSYRETYKVPELYSFGNDVVAPIYLKAIWVPNDRVDVKVVHHFLSLDLSKETKEPLVQTLANKRANYLVATTGDQQNDELTLASHEELEEKLTGDLKTLYEEYNKRVKANNTFFQQFRVEPAKKLNPATNQVEDNPDVKNNVFHFFYRPFRTRDYKVNYIDERFKDDPEKGKIIDQEKVSNGNRHFDARNYRPIPGWVLAENEKPQQQLFFDVDEETNAFKGINGTGKDEITFYYKDVRIIEVPDKNDPVPDGYVRVTFKADKGGSFGKDAQGKDITEINYDVIKGLKSDLLPVPKELAEGETADKDKYYITPETGKKFTKWDNKPLLNNNTIINEPHEFTAYFEWSGLTASGLVRTEAFKDPKGTWTNDFAPKIEDLKKQLVWKEKDVEKPLPEGAVIKFFDEAGNELTTDDQVYELVNEKKAADKDQLVRTVNVKAKVTFKDGKEPQELDIPITVYKNVYEALNKAGDKPLFLTEAEGKEAKDGGLKDVTGDYVMVTIKPTRDMDSKDDKIYWVNKNAWVEIPEVKPDGSSTFVNWTADQAGQNDDGKENGKFDFAKRHKFTTATIIQPVGAADVVEQTDPNKKPPVPSSYVKVIVDKTANAELGTDEKQTQTFWVNPTKEVSIPATDPVGKKNQKFTFVGLGEKDVNYIFKEWQKVKTGEADDSLTDVTPAAKIDLAKNKYTDKVTVIEAAYKKSIQAEPIVEPLKTKKLDTPQGKEITNDDLIKQITPQEGKEIKSIQVINKPDPSKPGEQKATVIVTYTDGTTQGTNENPVVIPVEVHKNIIPEAPGGQRPKDALANYVKVIFKAGEGGTVSGDLVYYVSPEVEVDMTDSAKAVTKTPNIGYTANGGTWSPEIKAEKITAEKTYEFNFVKTDDIVEKTDDSVKKPEGYVTVKFIAGENGKITGGNKTYFVNPEANIKLVDTATAGVKNELVIPATEANANYAFDKWVETIDYTNPIKGNREYVAKFTKNDITLTYDAGGGTGTVPAQQSAPYGGTVILAKADSLKKDHSLFVGWKLDGDDTIYQPGDSVTLEKARTATAQWELVKHKVDFDTQGGSTVPFQEVQHGGKLVKDQVNNPTKDGFVFMGWKEKGKEDEDAFFNLDSEITEKKTLVAQWEEAVKKIGENDTVDKEHFIKVTFLKGDHGKLKLADVEQEKPVIYKVAKDYSLEQAKANGLVVPGILPNKYYRAKDANSGWDNELKLEGKDATFTAQYEPMADVIPIDPKVTPDDKLQDDKPEGMVLVEFVVDDTKAFMRTASKFYVAANKDVTITPPTVYNRPGANKFEGWENVTLVEGLLKGNYSVDTKIYAMGMAIPDMDIQLPNSGDKTIYVLKLLDGATGKLEMTIGGQSKIIDSETKTTRIRKGRRIVEETTVFFTLPQAVKSGDVIHYWAEKDGLCSKVKDYTVK
ncbi:InlB B-repeat-containing protein [Aedoeadaptatus urinae]|uniref:InlB B-repeat-containing protein n=1 Tax=Aedoeadaptatus urinae TaxID=1871017 RepID=UPI00097D4BBB|nr:InlB B-repeat-containing protein [Peptoniphilus urinae]